MVQSVNNLLKDILNESFLGGTLSSPFSKNQENGSKVTIRLVAEQERIFFQCEVFQNNQVFHYNGNREETATRVEALFSAFKQMQLHTNESTYTVLQNKKGTVTIKRTNRKTVHSPAPKGHNKVKQYLLQEGVAVPFLVDLGVMTPEGLVVKSKYHKFRQINRFLEFIRDVLPAFSEEKPIRIIDFGCGKSYLTFATYYYLHEICGRVVEMTGLDLKEDVIRNCNLLCQKYGYDKLTFEVGNIADFQGHEVDMVVSLHACDVATDYAMEKAVAWGAKVIFAVPCCQHELNTQMDSSLLSPILSYGIIKERMAALVTDALRAQYLEQVGYDTQILEFIETEHTPKNLLIRGIKSSRKKSGKKDLERLEEELHVHPTLRRLLGEQIR